MSENKIKIFQMDDYTWYAGETAESCILKMMEDTGMTREDILCDDEDFPAEISDEQYDKYYFLEDDAEGNERKGEKKTFRQKLDEMIESGAKFPCFFATTEY